MRQSQDARPAAARKRRRRNEVFAQRKMIPRLLVALALLAACTPPRSGAERAPFPGPESVVTYRLLQAGAYAAAASAEPGTERGSRVLVASSPATYAALWREHIGDAPLPAVDFARESAVFLLLGQRSTGGWGVAPEGVAIAGDAVEVIARIARPQPGGITTMAFSAPFAVLAVDRPGIERAVWKDRDGSVVAAFPETAR